MKYAFAFLLPLLVMACGGNNETETMTEDVPTVEVQEPVMDANSMPDAMDAGMVSINETVTAVQNAGGDITAIQPAAAVSVVDGWINKLSGMPEASGIVANLQMLKTELSAGAINGKKVGDILIKLGAETKAIAPGNMALEGLSSALTAGGAKLSM